MSNANEDWPKFGTWDFWTPDWEPVTALDELWPVIYMPEGWTQKEALLAFMTLPAWQAAPQGLKEEASRWLMNA